MEAARLAPNNPRVVESLGVVAFTTGDYTFAEQQFSHLVELTPSEASSHVQLAMTNLKLNRIDEFETALARALDLNPHHREGLRLLADLNFQNERFKDAAHTYTKILSRYPDDLEALLPLGACFFKLGDFETAKLVFERVLERHPENSLAKENLEAIRQKLSGVKSGPLPFGRVEAGGWQSDSGIPKLEIVSEWSGGGDQKTNSINPAKDALGSKSEINRALTEADAAHKRGDFAKAKQLLTEALRTAPDEPAILTALGAVCFAENELDQAHRHLSHASQINSSDPSIFVQLALVNLRRDRIDEFESDLGRALNIDPDHRDALKLLGDLNLQSNHLKDAAHSYTKILSRHPADLEALLPLGICFFKDGDLETSRLVFERALEIEPGNSIAKENLEAIRQKVKAASVAPNVKSPERRIENAPVANPSGLTMVHSDFSSDLSTQLPAQNAGKESDNRQDLAKLMDQANFFCEVGNREAALETLLQAVEVAPHDARIRSALGSLHFSHGNYEAAREQFRRLIELRPRDSDAYTRLAMSCVHLDRIEEMEAALGLALEIDPYSREALKFLAKTNFEANRVRDAGRAYAKLLEKRPDDIESLLSLGLCFYRGGDFESARMVYNRVLEVDPNNLTARENLFQLEDLLSGIGQSAQEPVVSTPKKSASDKISRLNRLLAEADAAFGSQNLSGAREALVEALGFAPDSPEILSALGSVCFQLGNLEEARTHLRKLVQIVPSDPVKWIQLALSLYQLGDLPEFEVAIGRALALDPRNLEALRLLGQVKFNGEKFVEAARAFGKMLQQTPEDIEVLMPLGVCFFKVGDIESARMIFNRILELNPGNLIATENLEAVRIKLSKSPKTPNRTQDEPISTTEKIALKNLADTSRVIEGEKSNQSNASKAQVGSGDFLLKANSCWTAGDLRGACLALRDAASAEPDSHEIRAALGSVLYQLGDMPSCFEELKRAAELAPNSADYQTRLALALLALERLPEFETALARALEIDPKYRPALKFLADLNYREGRFQDAAHTYHKILLQAPDDIETMLPLAVCFYSTGDAEAAKMIFERVLQLDSKNVIARENLALINDKITPSSETNPSPPPSSESGGPDKSKKKKRKS